MKSVGQSESARLYTSTPRQGIRHVEFYIAVIVL